MTRPKGLPKAGGRAKGTPNKVTAEIKALAAKHGPEAIARLVFLMRNGENEAVQLAASNALLDRGYGRPAQAVAVGIGGEGGRMQIFVNTGVRRGSDNEVIVLEAPGEDDATPSRPPRDAPWLTAGLPGPKPGG